VPNAVVLHSRFLLLQVIWKREDGGVIASNINTIEIAEPHPT
jgi:hypothetical protein